MDSSLLDQQSRELASTALLAVAVLARVAQYFVVVPEGYQDEEGFHFGPYPETIRLSP